MILAGDIGGTNTRLALFEGRKNIREEKFLSRKYPDLGEIVLEFLQDGEKADKASFGIAGPIQDGKCKATNLPWVIDAKELSLKTNIPQVFLLNDLQANAYGLRALKEEEFFILNHGKPSLKGNAALISAGTGLGEAGLYWDGAAHHPFPSEGGHTDFSPRNDLEWELKKHLQKKFGHVSNERLVSGPGIAELYHFLVEEKKEAPLSGSFPDLPKAISENAVKQGAPLCEKVIDWFLSLYGAEAGNTALKFLAIGGVYIGGGIAPKLLPLFKKGGFMKAFVDKGRFQSLLEGMPVKIVLNQDTALLGALEFALLKIGSRL